MTTAIPTRSVIAGLVGSVIAATTLGPGAAPAAGATSVRSGWWTSAPLLVAPDVSAGQLLVQGGTAMDDPVAYAGITFVLTAGERPQTLTLTVGAGSASTPGTTLALCPLLAAATPARGAPASSGPAFDCTTRVDAPASPDGTAYEFDVSAVLGPGSLGVAVVASGPSDRVVLEQPDSSALQSTAPATGPGPGPTAPPTTTAPAAPPRPSGSVAGTPSSSGVRATTPTPPSPTAAPATGRPRTGTTTPPAAADVDGPSGSPAPAAPASSDARSLAPFGFFGMAVGAIALWSVSGQRPPSASSHPGDGA